MSRLKLGVMSPVVMLQYVDTNILQSYKRRQPKMSLWRAKYLTKKNWKRNRC